jgi:putative intracellular protease/amidase
MSHVTLSAAKPARRSQGSLFAFCRLLAPAEKLPAPPQARATPARPTQQLTWPPARCQSFPAAQSKEENMKIVMVLTSHDQLGNTGRKTGFWLEEFAAPYYVFTDAGVQLTLASPNGGQPPVDPKSDEPGNQTPAMARFKTDAAAQKALSQTIKLADVKSEDFDSIFYVGGHGPMWDLAESTVSKALLESFYNSGKVIALVCHSPGVLRHVSYKGEPLVKGKHVTGFTNGEEEEVQLTHVVPFLVEDELMRLGAIFEKVRDWQPYTVVDGRLLTGQNPASSTAAAQALLKLLGQKAATAS